MTYKEIYNFNYYSLDRSSTIIYKQNTDFISTINLYIVTVTNMHLRLDRCCARLDFTTAVYNYSYCRPQRLFSCNTSVHGNI